jgi:hypothetical protein
MRREIVAGENPAMARLPSQRLLVATVCCQSPLALPTRSIRPSGAITLRLSVRTWPPTGSITTSKRCPPVDQADRGIYDIDGHLARPWDRVR